MPLWNEIEGQTLNGLTLRKLLRSEGRTAWFSTEERGRAARCAQRLRGAE